MSLTKSQLEQLNNSSFPNNNSGYITPEILRTYNSSSIAATVNQDVYTADSASFDIRLDSIGGVTTASFNALTQSFNSFTQSINSFTQSTNVFTASISTSVGLLQTFSQSADSRYVQNSQTSSMAVSSSTYSITSSYAVNAQTASEARNLVIIARNGNQSTLSAGTVVHITGASGDNPIFNTASYDTELLSANTLGIIRSTTTSGADCEVVVNGIVVGVNTDPANGYAAGDVVYLGANGTFTRVQPQAPNQIVVLGQVLRAQQNNGSLYVSINNGWELNELHNVQINTPLTNDLLAYESSSYGLWKNKSISSLGLNTTSSFNAYTQSTNTFTASVSTSVGLLQTFSSSQYKADSSSFDSRILAAGGQPQVQDEGTILGNVTSFNFIGAGVTASVNSGTASINISAGGTIDTGSLVTTASFNAYTSSQDFKNTTFATTSSLNDLSASIYSTDSTQSSLINGKLDTASFNTFSQSVDSRLDSIEGAGYVTSTITASSLVTASFNNGTRNLTFTKGDSSTFSVNIPDVSGSTLNTGSFATTGSNSFTGSQSIYGVIQVSDAPVGPQFVAPTLFQGVGTASVAFQQFVNGGNYDCVHIQSNINSGSDFQDLPSDTFVLNTWLNIPTNTGNNPAPQFKRGLGITGSLSVTGSTSFSELTGSLASFSASVNSRILAGGGGINTSSFATTGSNNFVGNQTITGSLILSSSAAVELGVVGAVEITGSVAGNITAITVASSTASIDFSAGTFFTLTIPSSSVTYITGSNLKPGMTANIVLTQQATTGSVRFESSLFKFPSGSINTGSAVANAVDMVSVASINTTTLYSVTANRLQ